MENDPRSDQFYNDMEQQAMEQTQSFGEDYDPQLCQRTVHGRCILCERVGIKWDEPYLGKGRAQDFKRSQGDPFDYEELKGLLWVKSQENGNPMGPSKQDKAFARLFKPTTEYYSPVAVIPNWNPVFFQYGKEIGEALSKKQWGKNTDYKDFWHPQTGTNVLISKEEQPRIKYTVGFKRDQTEIPNASAVLQAVANMNFKDVIQFRMEKSVEFSRPHKLIPANEEREFRFLPWKWDASGFSSLFFIRAYYHIAPSSDRIEEVGCEGITKDMITAALTGEWNPFEHLNRPTQVQVPPAAPVTAPPPQELSTPPYTSPPGLTSSPIPDSVLPSTTGGDPPPPVTSQPMTAEQAPVPVFPGAGGQDIDSLLGTKPEADIPDPKDLQGHPTEVPANKRCYGQLFNAGDQFCQPCEFQVKCKEIYEAGGGK